METGGETTPSAAGLYGGERGVGGKLKKPSSRKPPTTPYARPPSSLAVRGERRWLSSLVDPAYRLIAGGATRLFPSFFAKSNSINALPAPNLQHRDKHSTETAHNGTSDEHNCDPTNGMSRITGIADPSKAAESGSKFDGHKLDKKGDLSDVNGLSEIEQLLEGKKFSREEVNRLMEIIHSRAVELPTGEHEKKNQSITAGGEAKVPVIADDVPNISSEEKQDDLNKAIWGTSTPRPQSAMRDEVGASPVEIARAFMRDERAIMHGDDFASKPFIPPPSPKPSTCWPGSMVQDQRDYLTPRTERGRYGLHSFPRTPYSRTIFSKSKSKLTQLQGGKETPLRTPSTHLKQLQTPIYGQLRGDAPDGGYSSGGPIRGIRHKAVAQTPSRGSPYVHSSPIGTSQAENSSVTKGFLPTVKKNFESGGLRGNSQFQSIDRKPSSFEVGVHPQSSQIARTILEHIDRNPPTPKDKSEELRLAIAWKKPSSSGVPSVNPNGYDRLPLGGGFSSHKLINQDYQQSSNENADKGNSLFKVPPQENTGKATDAVSKTPAGDGSDAGSEVPNQQKKPPSQSLGTKRVFPSISVDKPGSEWKFSSDNSSGFTFPVSTSSAVFSEPPTPSIMPPLLAISQQQQKDGHAVPVYSFGSKKSASLDFTFPSTSAAIQNAAEDIKFSFGSDKPRLSFGSIGKDAICY